MEWRKENLDLVLVPSGLLMMIGYHLFLLYRYIRCPMNTILGYEDHSRRTWARKVMQVDVDRRDTAFTVISNNITAATFMASTSLALTSFIGAFVASSSSQPPITRFIYGSTSLSINSIKFTIVLIFFWLAFGAFVQCARSNVNANFLMSMPQADVPVQYVEDAVIEGNHFWQIGLRGIYFASTLLMWVFGPIPLLVSCLTTVVMLYILDKNKTPFHDFQQKTRRLNT